MLSNTVPIRIPHFRALLPVALVLLATVVGAADAVAGVAWHPDLASARRASAASQRPVLAIFTASWSSVSTTLDRTTLASDEAVALIAACFEPVCVDVDAHPETTRRLGVNRVPTACVLTAEEQPLSTFELPETPAEFVAAAARAAQEAAIVTTAGRQQPRPTNAETASSRHAISDLSAGGSSALPDLSAPSQPQPRGSVPPGGQAITAVAAKVRKLSDFARDDAPSSADSAAIAASFRNTAADPQGPYARETSTLAAAPTASPASASMVPTIPHTAFNAQPETVAPAPPTEAAGPLPTAAVAASSAPPLPDKSLAEIAVRAPLSIEPEATVAPTTAAAALKSPPWLAATAAAPALPTTTPSPATQAALPAPEAGQVASPASGATAGPPAAPPTAPQPAGAGPVTALAEAAPQKQEKPAASGSQSLLATLQKPFALFAPKAKPKATPEGQDAAAGPRAAGRPESAPAEAVAAKSAPAETDQYGSMPVGLEGYCPVTLAEKGAWVEGRAQWGVRHRGRTYLFAGAEQQKAFLADPDRYAPALSGDDPVLAFDAGKCTPGQRRYGVTYQSRMYLFSSTETRDAFAANPQRYTAGAVVAENRMPTSSGSVVR